MKLDRLIGILTVLQQKKKTTAPELAERFEVSRRTIQRDIETLCGAGFPIVTEQGTHGGISLMEGFVEAVARKVLRLTAVPAEVLAVGGCEPIRPYYKPRDREGNFINILKVKPKTDLSKCNGCGLCASLCPVGSIDASNPAEVSGICIKCCACVKGCPEGAKYYDDEG